MATDTFTRLRYRLWPGHLIGEVLSKRWTETAIPVTLLIAVVLVFSTLNPHFLNSGALSALARQTGEIGLIVMGLSLVMIVGGIDMSVGSTFALCNFVALYLIHALGWAVAPAIAVTLSTGLLLGTVNGLLIGYLGLRAFLTTLITLVVYRAAYDMLSLKHTMAIASVFPESEVWFFVGDGKVLGLPFITCVFALLVIFGHIFLTRLRAGWHVTAIGGGRRSAHNSGVKVKRTIAVCYAVSGGLAALAACSFAARLGTVSGDVGMGLEVTALTAAVVGGISLGGGNGSVTKVVVGTLIVLIITNNLVSLSVSGGVNRMVLATILILAVIVDIKWIKNRHNLLAKIYVSPDYLAMPEAPVTASGSSSPYAMNDALGDVELIGLGRIEGPEDVILDRNDVLYSGSRHGHIMRFLPPDYEKMEVFAHIGGTPLGMAFDRYDNLYCCIGGMGLYRVSPEGVVAKATDETNRSLLSINDDSRLRLADDLDIAPDGRVFFSEATTRYEMHEWATDGLEARGNGRIICYDPNTNKTHTVLRNLIFPNGISMSTDGQSFFYAETWRCTVSRYYFAGPRAGQCEVVIPNLPGYPDNINRASDGNYWLALTGMRSPVFDLSLKVPSFRRRMSQQLAYDEWLFPNVNTGCIVKFNEQGEILDTLWDAEGENHPNLTSMREHKGSLFIGGLVNNRIGRLKLNDRPHDPEYDQYATYWDKIS